MRKLFVSLVALALLLGGTIPLRAADKVEETPYYPYKVGSSWTYKVGSTNTSVTVKVAKHEKIGDVTAAVLETSVNGNVVTTEYVVVKADGVYRYKAQGQAAEPPLRFLKLPAKEGDKWDIDCKVGPQAVKGGGKIEKETEVTVPAGKYKTIVSSNDVDIAGQKITSTYYFAKDVGMVKQTAKLAGQDVVLELEKYEAGK